MSVLLVINLKEEDKDETLQPVDSSHCDLDLLSILHTQDDEELRVLASLRREQEEDECKASGLSASQIHRCNISISSDDTSTWTHISLVCTVMLCYSSSFIDSSLTSRTCAANLALTSLAGCSSFCLLSRIFLFDPGWSSFLLISISSPDLHRSEVLMHLFHQLRFCIIKGYWNRNTLIGLFQFLNIHCRHIHRSLSD